MPLSDKAPRHFRHQPYQNGGISPSGDGLTLELVLQNQAPSPFSFREFADYLEQTYCAENLAFYMAVTDYAQSARLYFGDAPDDPDTPVAIRNKPFWFTEEDATLNHEEQIRFDTLKAKFEDILQRFILTNAAQEVNIPSELRQHLLHTYHEKQSYHPALLRPACVAVIELMRISAFIPFVTDPARLVAVTPAPSKTTTPHKKPSSSQHASPLALSPRRLRSSPTLASSLQQQQQQQQQNQPPPPVPPLPTSPLQHDFGSSLSVVPPDDGCSVSNLSMASTASSTSSSATILKRLTTSFRLRARSQSPPRLSSWRQITIPDPNAFLEKQQSPVHNSSNNSNSHSNNNNHSHQHHHHSSSASHPHSPHHSTYLSTMGPSAASPPTRSTSISTSTSTTPPTMERGMSNSSITSTSSTNTNSSSRTSVTTPTVSAKYLTTPPHHCLPAHPTSPPLK